MFWLKLNYRCFFCRNQETLEFFLFLFFFTDENVFDDVPWEWKWTHLFFSFRSFLVREQPFSFMFLKSFKNIDFVRSLNFRSFSIHFCQILKNIRSFSQKTIVFKRLFKQPVQKSFMKDQERKNRSFFRSFKKM